MEQVFKVFLSLSLSGSVMFLFILSFKYLLKNKISRQWQYYIWLIAIGCLLIPFAPEKDLPQSTIGALNQTLAQANSFTPVSADRLSGLLPEAISLLTGYLWPIWLIGALLLLVRKITVYQCFIRFMKASQEPVTDPALLDQIAMIADTAGIKKVVDLSANPLISSPLLIGFFRPCILMPDTNIPEMEFQYTVLHELTHYKRLDSLYKWLIQIVLCLHWFNPLVYLMVHEINKDCEFSCDEAIIAGLSFPDLQNYGKTLLNAMSAGGNYREANVSINLSANKKLLKERLGTIMNFRKKSKLTVSATLVLTFLFCLSASALGTYAAPAIETADHKAAEQSVDTYDLEDKDMQPVNTYYLDETDMQPGHTYTLELPAKESQETQTSDTRKNYYPSTTSDIVYMVETDSQGNDSTTIYVPLNE